MRRCQDDGRTVDERQWDPGGRRPRRWCRPRFRPPRLHRHPGRLRHRPFATALLEDSFTFERRFHQRQIPGHPRESGLGHVSNIRQISVGVDLRRRAYLLAHFARQPRHGDKRLRVSRMVALAACHDENHTAKPEESTTSHGILRRGTGTSYRIAQLRMRFSLPNLVDYATGIGWSSFASRSVRWRPCSNGYAVTGCPLGGTVGAHLGRTPGRLTIEARVATESRRGDQNDTNVTPTTPAAEFQSLEGEGGLAGESLLH